MIAKSTSLCIFSYSKLQQKRCKFLGSYCSANLAFLLTPETPKLALRKMKGNSYHTWHDLTPLRKEHIRETFAGQPNARNFVQKVKKDTKIGEKEYN